MLVKYRNVEREIDPDKLSKYQSMGYVVATAVCQEEKKEVNLSKMKVEELRKFASEKGIDVPEGLNKAELLAVIENGLSAA